jgi:NitT/TauT family transport system permease protein
VARGIFLSTCPIFARVLDPWIAALYPLPKMSLIPLLIILAWCWRDGQNSDQRQFGRVPCCDQPLRRYPPDQRRSHKDGDRSEDDRRQIQLKVVIPAAVPSIFSGSQPGMGISIILARRK